MDVAEAMSRELLVVPPELGLNLAWRIMQQQHIHHLLVGRANTLLGLLSDREVLLHARPGARGEVVVSSEPVAAAMVTSPTTCEPDVPISHVARMMTDYGVDALPVVDGCHLVGLVTSNDLLQLLTDRSTTETLPFRFQLEEATDEDWASDGGAGS